MNKIFENKYKCPHARLYFFNPVLSPQVKIYSQLTVVQVSTSLKGTCSKGTSELYSRPQNPLLHPSPSPSQQAATPDFQGLTILSSLFSHPTSKCGHFQNDAECNHFPHLYCDSLCPNHLSPGPWQHHNTKACIQGLFKSFWEVGGL